MKHQLQTKLSMCLFFNTIIIIVGSFVILVNTISDISECFNFHSFELKVKA